MELDPNNAIARVDARRVLMALPFRPYGEPRHYLNCLALQPTTDDGVLVMATDGHIAVCIRDIGGRADRPMLLPIGKGQKAQLKTAAHVLVSPEGVTWIADEGGFPLWVSTLPLVEGSFVNLSAVLGDFDQYQPGLVGEYNPALLDRISQTYAHKKRAQGVRFYHRPDNTAAALFTLNSDGFGVVMSLKSDDEDADIRDSIPQHFQQQEAAA